MALVMSSQFRQRNPSPSIFMLIINFSNNFNSRCIMKIDDQAFQCIDQQTELLKHQAELKQTINKLTLDNSLLLKEMQVKDSFKNILSQQKTALDAQVIRLEEQTTFLSKAVNLAAQGQRFTEDQMKNLQNCIINLSGLRDSLALTIKSFGQKVQGIRSGETNILQQIKRSFKDVKQEMSLLYQQIIQQKNKQIKSLKAKVQDAKVQVQAKSQSQLVLQKTTSIEDQIKYMMSKVDKISEKDKQMSEYRVRICQLQKTLTLKQSQISILNQKLQIAQRKITQILEAAYKDKQQTIREYQKKLSQAQNRLKCLPSVQNTTLAQQLRTSSSTILEKLQLMDYQLSRSCEFGGILQTLQQKVTQAITNQPQSNSSLYLQSIDQKLKQMPQLRCMLVSLHHDIKQVLSKRSEDKPKRNIFSRIEPLPDFFND